MFSGATSGRRGSFVSTTGAAKELKRELKQMERRRSLAKPKRRFSITDLLVGEKNRLHDCEQRISEFITKLDEAKAQEMSKWTLKELEEKLFL